MENKEVRIDFVHDQFLEDSGVKIEGAMRDRVVSAMVAYANWAVEVQRELMARHLNMRNVPKPKI